jgi:hypothetical protein
MSIQHKNIPDAELHESKGVASAVLDTAYFANGSGSGSWKKVGIETLKGITSDAGIARLKLVSDGANGFKLYRDTAFANMTIADNSVPFPITAAADTTLDTGSQYSVLTGSGAPFVNTLNDNITFSVNKLTFTTAGVYDLNFWANVTAFPSNTAKVAFRFRVNGTNTSTLYVINKSNSNGDASVYAASDLVHFSANDYVQLVIASDTTGNILVHNANLTAKLIKAD